MIRNLFQLILSDKSKYFCGTMKEYIVFIQERIIKDAMIITKQVDVVFVLKDHALMHS